MFNPFLKRASEHLRDDDAFLATVSAVPVRAYVAPKVSALFDRLVIFTGTPGSGKTTFAKLLRFSTLSTLNRLATLPEHRDLLDAMTQIGATANGLPQVAGSRLPMDPRYREIWELPYSPELRNKFLARLIQARAVQEWVSGFKTAGLDPDTVTIVPRAVGSASLESVGGRSLDELALRAKSVETAIFKITRALIPPSEADLPAGDLDAYDPFNAIEAFRHSPSDGKPRDIKPLVLLDDAHDLHGKQYEFMTEWLRQREIGPARWVLTRLDVLGSKEVLGEDDDVEAKAGFEAQRELTYIRLQGGKKGRGGERSEFRSMATDISKRALSQLDTFSRKGLVSLSSLLETNLPELADKAIGELDTAIEKHRSEKNVNVDRVSTIMSEVEAFSANKSDMTRGVKLKVASILLHRYTGRTQTSLFDDEDPEPSRELNIGPEIVAGARLQLMHETGAPFYYGFSDLADGSWENAQQFLTFAAAIVDAIETKIIRDRGHILDANEQNKILRDVGRSLVEEWSFPFSSEVRSMTDWIAQVALARTMLPNAPLSAGANSVAIPQEQFEALKSSNDKLLSVLKYGVAYNAISILPDRTIKGRPWTLIELGGPLVLMHGLPLRRGGTVHKTLKELQLSIRGDE
ncbi:hypothetical protein [Devosia sp. Leaf64]|uniref:hypothetical protein n=1 Tax=Devosia sp. Leaf64 TaxID=1736229 RepID=UPI000712FEE6|nr:hypothetical protein [Devosia sp. Leaf64]KQN75046.1 hypothetical protein ASE94_01630 [Devosia sp. Leaf64]